jgi:MFS family permease
MAFYNVGWGIVFPMRALYFREPSVGLSWQELGWLGFVRSAISMVIPLLFGSVSDRTGRQKEWLLGGFAASSLATSLFLVGRSFWDIALISAFDAMSMIAYNVNLNALVSVTLDENARGRQFGQFRIAGSVGYGIASFLVVPLVTRDPTYRAVFLTGAGVYLVCFVVTVFWIRDVPASMRKSSQKAGWKSVVRQRNLMTLYVAQAVSSIGGSMCYSFFSNHLNETYGLSPNWVGIMYGIMTLSEIPALVGMGWASDRWGRKPILVLAFLSSGVRWSLVGVVPTAGWLVPPQLLWGIAFSGYTVGVALMTELVEPQNRGAAFGILNFAFGIGSVIGPPLGGYIAEHAGLPAVFQVGGTFSLIAGIGLILFLQPGKRASKEAIPALALATLRRRGRH